MFLKFSSYKNEQKKNENELSSFFGELWTELSSLFLKELKMNEKFVFWWSERELELVRF